MSTRETPAFHSGHAAVSAKMLNSRSAPAALSPVYSLVHIANLLEPMQLICTHTILEKMRPTESKG